MEYNCLILFPRIFTKIQKKIKMRLITMVYIGFTVSKEKNF